MLDHVLDHARVIMGREWSQPMPKGVEKRLQKLDEDQLRSIAKGRPMDSKFSVGHRVRVQVPPSEPQI